MTDFDLAADFRQALRPLIRRFSRDRTISLGKFGMLGRLADIGPATASELAAAERITPQAAATALREMEDLAYVARMRDEVDRRKVLVRITDQGRVALESERAAGTRWLEKALHAQLDGSEREAIAAVIPVLRTLMRDVADE